MEDWDDGPTIEDEIRWNDELSPTQKKLLLKQEKLNSFRVFSGMALYLFFACTVGAFVGMLFKSWLCPLVGGALIWAGVIGYTLLKDEEQRIKIALEEEHIKQQEMKKVSSRNKTRRIPG
jgi:hypothetical protein